MAVVVLLFIAVLKQFGILEPMSMEGNACPPPSLPSAGAGRLWGREPHAIRTRGRARLAPPPGPPFCSGALGLGLGG